MADLHASHAHAAHHWRGSVVHPLCPPPSDLIRVGSRRWFLQTGLAGLAGLSLADTLRMSAAADQANAGDRRAVILFWLSGGPSHIDMWDPKPNAPHEIRGPYQTIGTSVPGIEVCEHLPLQASLMHKLSILRSVDCSASNHTPITMQAGNALARRTDNGNDGGGYPSMGSVVARFRGPNAADLPAFVGLADSWKADVWGAGHLGQEFEPVQGGQLAGRLAPVDGVTVPRLQDRAELRRQFDRLSRDLDRAATMHQVDRYQQMAFDMVAAGRVKEAFDVSKETDAVRDAYGRISVGEKALLARRLVEAGVTFVLVSGRWGYFDHHGDNVPPWGGIVKGLTPILPTIDRAMHALVTDLDQRGLLDSTLVLMLGEFGRAPMLSPDGGRGHWTNCMSMLVAGGGLPSGQVIGRTDRKGYDIQDARVHPSDLAATVFRHLRIDLDAHWVNPQGRPIPIVTEGGQPIPGLV
ncbi:MAG TPA: DUF1501 domain-containing protein [Pirellulales bacterium]|nr:DUF1501 domain-containing protein [Pirellulales bacterium]